MTDANIICDSVNPNGDRLTTFVLTYPRFLLAEMNTNRVFSRNTSSSRAVPVWKMIAAVLKNPFKPVVWGQTQKGMQSTCPLPRSKQFFANLVWMFACYIACLSCWLLYKLKLHKQWANRLIEPFSYITTIVTATQFENFFALRCHEDAQPEIQVLADLMLKAYVENKPKRLEWGEWHLPFADKYLDENISNDNLLKIVTARCARVSYLNFFGNIDHEKDYELHDDLLKSGHVSPAEHAAEAMDIRTTGACGNFTKGWVQYRKTILNECRSVDLNKLLVERTCKEKLYF